ncbi:Hypothetical_protein [Hexamita inflata]|uniref:Hypothetical_protein n=1 Tax=Hexamita inflata TaxID=28002 RepID=A0AA86Q5W9_9EUKA|nr:Hypothetical protein HINF_LOCUS39448 [Hexamita inflata]
MQRLEPIRFITGMYSIIIIVRQIYVNILAQLFTQSGDVHIQNVISLHKFGIHGILFVQGFRMHVKINQRSYNIYELLKNLAMQYMRQAIPLILMLLLTINIPWFARNKCNHEHINYLEFLQIPALLDNSNTCGAIIHMYSTQCFFNLLLICTYILFEILNISKTNIKAAYISQLGFWFLVQIILVSQRSKSSIDVEYQMLEGTLDGQSYYSGALFGYYLFNLSPMQDAKESRIGKLLQLWEVELLFLVYYVSNYILKYFATSNADDKFQQIISSWRLFMNYSLTQEGQKYDFDRIRPQSTIQSRYLIFQKGKIEITTCNKRTAMTKINAVEDVQGRSTNSLNKLRQF